jgi:Anti-sigma-K factor rskA
MTDEHELVEELLAGHALAAQSDQERHATERALSDHVPGCLGCRQTLAELEYLTGELALAVSPVEPPELLKRRLLTEIGPDPVAERSKRRWPHPRSIGSWIAAAAAIAVVGLVTWNTVLNQRLGHIQHQQQDVTRATAFITQPDTQTYGLTGQSGDAHVVMGVRPQETSVVLFGSDVAPPAPGKVYRLWLGTGGAFRFVREFVPDAGIVALFLRFDSRLYDEILITEEPVNTQPTTPHGAKRWIAEFTPAP